VGGGCRPSCRPLDSWLLTQSFSSSFACPSKGGERASLYGVGGAIVAATSFVVLNGDREKEDGKETVFGAKKKK